MTRPGRPHRRRIASVRTTPSLHPVVPTIRPAQPEDAHAVERVHEAAIRAFGPDAYDDVQVAAWAAGGVDETGAVGGADQETVAERDDGRYVVAEVDGAVAGFGCLRPDAIPDAPADRLLELVDRDVAEVTAVYVHPDHARTGLGTAILDALERRARDGGATVVGLLAAKNAVGFYEHNGYESFGTRQLEPAEGVTLAGIWMERRLTEG